MASKNLYFIGLFFLVAYSAHTQSIRSSYDVTDSSLIPNRRMPQHSEFLSGKYNFPAMPRNMWEFGIKVGHMDVSGDIPSRFTPASFGAHIRKAFGYVFSLRLEYMYGLGRGWTFNRAENFGKNTAWARNGSAATSYSAPYRIPGNPDRTVSSLNVHYGAPANTPREFVFYNYRTRIHDLHLEGVVTLNNIRFHKAKTGVVLYGFAGVGGMIYDTKVDALDGGNRKYNFATITPNNAYKTRKDTYKALKNLLDGTYETPAENQGPRRPKLFGSTLKPSGTIGMGVAFRVGRRFNIALEDRHVFTKDDLIDGQRWQEHAYGDAVLTGDFDSYNLVSLNLNFNIGAKAVEPLWWLNPLDYVYGELRNPRLMNIPKPSLEDSDGDGVINQFDREQTPAGCPVDTHGVSRDTDGDGVPDCKDKELVTPTYCQPVDADGVGKCPCPTCETCPDLCKGKPSIQCESQLGDLPSITFPKNSARLTNEAKTLLNSVAAKLRNAPGCKVVVVGYCSSSKQQQQLSWDHVNAVINYLVDQQGISQDRFIFRYGEEGGDCDTVDLRAASADEEGPNMVEPPHPRYRKSN